MEITFPKYVCRKGFTKRLCLTVLDYELFETQLSKYMTEVIIPRQIIRKDRILARRVLHEKYGPITKGVRDCINAGYVCKNCLSKDACAITLKYNKNESRIAKIARMFEMLYGNLQGSYWEELVS